MAWNSQARFTLLGGVAVLSIGSGAAAAAAEETPVTDRGELEEVIVTASKRGAEVQSLPMTVAAVTTQGIMDAGAQTFSGLLNSLSGVEMRNPQPGLGGVTIRGISELNSANQFGGSGSATSLYLDEIPLTSAGIFPEVSSFDLARVEVLKGPQGTLFGEGSIGGTVRLISNAPDPARIAAAADLTYSSTEDGGANQIYNGMVNVPIGDKSAFRAVGYYKDMGGYIDNYILSQDRTIKDANTDQLSGGRFSYLYAPNDRLSVSVTALINNADRGSQNLATKDFTTTLSVPAGSQDDLQAYNGTVKYSYDFADLIVTGSYFTRTVDSVIDQAGLVPGVNYVFGLLGIPITAEGVFINQDIEADTTAIEARLVSNRPGSLQWTAGLFYKDLANDYSLVSDGVPSVPPQVWEAISGAISGGALSISEGYYTNGEGSNKQIAAFGELTYDFASDWQILAGGRLFDEQRDSTTSWGGVFPLLTGGPPPGTLRSSGDNTLFKPRVSLRYRYGDDAMSYFTYSTGFRSGGQNDLYALVPGGTPDYKPEELTSYELGLKSTWMDNRLLFNAAAFYLDWKDIQAVTAEGPGGIGETIGNIGSAHSMGVEFELKAVPMDGLELSLATTLLQAETDDAVTVPDPDGGPAQVVPSGTRIPRTAETTVALGATYRFAITDGIGGFARANYAYTGDVLSSLTRRDEITPASNVVNLRVGLESGKWQLYVFSDNLTNEKIHLYQSNVNEITTGADQYYFGRPRMVGINLRVSY